MTTVPTALLNNGHGIPLVGLGSWMMKQCKKGDIDEPTEMIVSALKMGYTHVDSASFYNTEEAVAAAVKLSGIAREQLFVTTKIAQQDHADVAGALDRSLKELEMEYLDLLLLHWPHATVNGKTIPLDQSPTFSETWAEMEKTLSTGKVKSIGVSNFSIKNLEILLKTAKIVPAVNQVEIHPYLPQEPLRQYCEDKGIHLTAYCPIGQGNSPILREQAVLDIADAHTATAGQVVLSWAVQRGISVVPKSSNPQRQKENMTLIKLTDEEMKQISDIHKQEGCYRSLCSYSGGTNEPGKLFGLDLKEDLGWDYEITRD